jgi:prepilin-type N-terminal cleavage/methylation domain-containing protein
MRSGFGFFRANRGERGFTLVEVIAAIGILGVITLSLAYSMIHGYRSLRDTRFFQQATGLGNEVLEGLRDSQFDDLVMLQSDVTADSATAGICPGLTGTRFYDPDGPDGDMTCEKLVTAASDDLVSPALSPHITTEDVDGKEYTVSRYITWVDKADQGGPAEDYKRVTVIVSWDITGTPRTFRASTLMTDARRGLPIPGFELTPDSQTVEVSGGETVVFPHSIKNLGITDAYDLEVSVPAGKSWVVRFYKDNGQIGVLEAADTPLTVDTNGTGVVDTGIVETNETFHFLVVWDLESGEASGSTTVTLTATSGVDEEMTETAEDTLLVTFIDLGLFLHNRSTPPTSDTETIRDMPMNETAPTAGTLFEYSTNYYTGSGGRIVNPSALVESSSTFGTRQEFLANWVYQLPMQTKFDGPGQLRISVASTDPECDNVPSFTYWIRDRDSSGDDVGSVLATGTLSPVVGETCSLVEVVGNLNLNDVTIATNHYLEVKIRTDESTGSGLLFGYDTTVYPSKLTVRQVATSS